MSSIDKLRPFADSKELDALPLAYAQLNYGDLREIYADYCRMRWALDGAHRVIRIAASYHPDEWPNVGLKIHCTDAKIWAEHARQVLLNSYSD